MGPIRETQKKYCSQALIAAIIIGLILILTGQKPLGKGLILGTLFSVVNFVLIGELISLQLGRAKAKTAAISLGSIFLRFGLLALPLVLAVKYEQFNLVTVICGIFMIQIMIMADHLRKSIMPVSKK